MQDQEEHTSKFHHQFNPLKRLDSQKLRFLSCLLFKPENEKQEKTEGTETVKRTRFGISTPVDHATLMRPLSSSARYSFQFPASPAPLREAFLIALTRHRSRSSIEPG